MSLEPTPESVSIAAGRAEAAVAFFTVCTTHYLPYARVLGESLERFHPEIDFYVVLTDWAGGEDARLGRGILVPIEALDIDRLPYQRLKLSAAHLCYAAKSGASIWLAGRGYSKVVYGDADLEIFAPLSALLAALDDHRFVTIPHLLAPFPFPERRYEHPSLGELASAGVCNAGLFGFVPDAASLAFHETWQDMVLAPESFLDHQAEQNAFNWLPAFVDRVAVLRDSAYNVAYWNLHDRSLRWCGFDGGDEDTWQVDGKGLVVFHFSGLAFDRPAWLSGFDTRHSLYTLPSVARLVERYVDKLVRHGRLEATRTYRYDRFPSGLPIDARMRAAFCRHELQFWRDLDPFTPPGEQHYCRALLQPAAGTYLIPALLFSLYQERADLQSSFPEARLRPQRLIRWFCSESERLGYGPLLDLFRPTLAKREPKLHLAALCRQLPVAFADLAAPLAADRPAFIDRLEQAGLISEANGVRSGEGEYWEVCPIDLVRELVAGRPDLRQNFPDVFGEHRDHLADWLEGDGVLHHDLRPGLGELFRRKARDQHALARIYSHYRRYHQLMEAWPFAFVGEDSEGLAASLLEAWPDDCEFDLDDVAMFLWMMAEQPWVGVAATLEAPVHAGRQPSPLLPAGQEALLARFLTRSPAFGRELARYRQRQQSPENFLAQHNAGQIAGHVGLREGMRHPALAGERGLRRGINVFGYFKSPGGLGSLSRGLAQALQIASFEVAENVVGNMAMVPELRLADLLGTYRYDFTTNIFVSYPHLHSNLLKATPQAAGRGRRNIVYLAWEQRDFHHWWREIYQDFDQLWALSSFAAEAIGRGCGREVLALPAAIDFAEFPPAAGKEEVGLDPRQRTFLYVFDANSSIERKNPAAAIEAFRRAFAPEEKVELLIKASNVGLLQHRRQLLHLYDLAARSGRAIRFLTEPLTRHRLLQLISAVDGYLSLHRSEGFGYTCAEAMAYGVPAIATGYSGNLDFMDETCSYLVRAKEVEVQVPDGPFQRGSVWAEPELDHAAELLRRVYENPAAAAEVGARGARRVREVLAVEKVAARVARALG